MSEPYWPKHKNSYRLSDAERNGSVAHMRCRYCKIERYFLISDLRKLFGDVECDDVTDRHIWRCSNCAKTHTVSMALALLSAVQRQGVTFRRLDRIEYIRKVFWRDEKA
jgi:hypothetical protein